jgi:hypothetical protein
MEIKQPKAAEKWRLADAKCDLHMLAPCVTAGLLRGSATRNSPASSWQTTAAASCMADCNLLSDARETAQGGHFEGRYYNSQAMNMELLDRLGWALCIPHVAHNSWI